MKHLFYIIFLIVITVNAQTSGKDEVTYLDSNQNPTSKENASFYEFNTLYKDSIIKYQKYFIASSTKAYLVEKYFYDKDGEKQAKYESFRNDGTKIKEGYYKDDLKNGPWKYFDIKALDSSNNSEVFLQKLVSYKNNIKNGKFKDFYQDSSIQGEGQYKNDNFIGECKWYHRNGQLSSLETYNEKGKLKTIQQWDDKGVEKTKKLLPNHDTKSSIKILSGNITRYLYNGINKNIYKKYPSQSGKVYAQILLDKKGKIHVSNIYSTSGISTGFENEIKKILEKMPLQKPIYFHNQLVDANFTLPILIASSKENKF